MKPTKDQIAKAQEIAKRLGVSEEELDQYLANGKTSISSDPGKRADSPSQVSRMSGYEKSIVVAVLIGLCIIVRTVVKVGFMSSMGTMAYVLFCLFMISSQRLFEHRVGTYIIGTDIHLPPARRPMWGAAIALGWFFLALPALLTVYWAMTIQE